MRTKILLISSLAALVAASAWVQHLYFPRMLGQSAYLFQSIYWVCGVVTAILGGNMVWHQVAGSKTENRPASTFHMINRRNTFRIIYPTFLQPMLVVENIDDQAKRQLEFPIVDLSQGGSCFLDDGSLGKLERFTGHIRFSNGDRTRVAGSLVRQSGNQVCVQFAEAIEWSILLEEQRRVLVQMKSSPAPAGPPAP